MVLTSGAGPAGCRMAAALTQRPGAGNRFAPPSATHLGRAAGDKRMWLEHTGRGRFSPGMTQTCFTVATRGPGLYDITRDVSGWVATQGGGDGLLTLFIRHTSASLLIQENADPAVQRDLAAYFARLVPRADDPAMAYLTHRQEGADDMPAHIKAVMMPVSLTIPVQAGHLQLGTWQGIYVVEHRDAPHRRDVAAHLC